jgi:hypothetical protein
MGQFDTFLNTYGSDVTWKQRQIDGSYVDKGSIKAIVQSLTGNEKANYGAQDIKKLYTSTALKIGDQIVFDSQTWDVGPVDHFENATLGESYYKAILRGSQIPA